MWMSTLWLADALSFLIIAAVLSVWQQAAEVAGTLTGKRAQWTSFVRMIALQGCARLFLGLSERFDVFFPLNWTVLGHTFEGPLELMSFACGILSIALAYKLFDSLFKGLMVRTVRNTLSATLVIGICAGAWLLVPTAALLNQWTSAIGLVSAGISLLILGVTLQAKNVQRVGVMVICGGAIVALGALTHELWISLIGSMSLACGGMIAMHVRVKEIFKNKVPELHPMQGAKVYLITMISFGLFVLLGYWINTQPNFEQFMQLNSGTYLRFSTELLGWLGALIVLGVHFRHVTVVVARYIERMGVERAKSLLNGIDVAAFLCQKSDGTIIECSKSALVLIGIGKGDLLGSNVWNMLGIAPVQNSADRMDILGRTLHVTREALGEEQEHLEVITALDVSAQKRAERALEHLAAYDALTELPNRREVLARLENALDNKEHGLALLFLDLDHFKTINDTKGHEVGDKILQRCAHLFAHVCKEHNAWVGRLGGDEFVAVGNNSTVERCTDLANALIDSLQEPSMAQTGIGLSIGMALYPDHAQTVGDLLRRADAALYESKGNGRGRATLFNDAIEERILRLAFVEEYLRKALKEQKGLEIYVQPMLSPDGIFTGKAEALVRVPKEVGIGGGELVAVAERGQMIASLGRFILEESISFAQRCEQAGVPICISVNVSAKQFSDDAFWQRLKDVMPSEELRRIISLEMTETALMSDVAKAKWCLLEAKEMGLDIALDDFGSGYSSLSMLQSVPLTKIKLDKTLLDKVPKDHQAVKIATAAIAMGKALDLGIVSEGIESIEQIQWLKEQGVDWIQGYYFSTPLSEKDFLVWGKKQYELQQMQHKVLSAEKSHTTK